MCLDWYVLLEWHEIIHIYDIIIRNLYLEDKIIKWTSVKQTHSHSGKLERMNCFKEIKTKWMKSMLLFSLGT